MNTIFLILLKRILTKAFQVSQFPMNYLICFFQDHLIDLQLIEDLMHSFNACALLL